MPHRPLGVLAVASLFAFAGCRCGGSDRGAGPAASAPPTASASAAVPADALGYMTALKAKRPDLMVGEGCYQSLVAKRRYRGKLLGGTDSIPSLQQATYTEADRAKDRVWMKALEDAELAYCRDTGNAGDCAELCKQACAVCPDGGLAGGAAKAKPGAAPPAFSPTYALCNYAGFVIGDPNAAPFDASGKVKSYDVYFELADDFTDRLTPAAYLELAKALAAAGFKGRTKIPLGGGRVRYQYNGLIVHARSPADAKIVEDVAAAKLGSVIAAHARGVALATSKVPAGELDWHHYLCAEGTTGIPAEALAYVAAAN